MKDTWYAAHCTPPLSALCRMKQQQKTPRAQRYTSSLVIPYAHGKLNVKHHRITPKPEISRSITAAKDEAELARKNTEHQNVDRWRSSNSSASVYILVYTSEADFHTPGIYGGRVRLWATEWDVFHCTPCQGGRGRRAAVDIFCVFF